jgi:hypothetical protein
MGSLIACKPLDILAMDFTILEKSSDGRENVLIFYRVHESLHPQSFYPDHCVTALVSLVSETNL